MEECVNEARASIDDKAQNEPAAEEEVKVIEVKEPTISQEEISETEETPPETEESASVDDYQNSSDDAGFGLAGGMSKEMIEKAVNEIFLKEFNSRFEVQLKACYAQI